MDLTIDIALSWKPDYERKRRGTALIHVNTCSTCCASVSRLLSWKPDYERKRRGTALIHVNTCSTCCTALETQTASGRFLSVTESELLEDWQQDQIDKRWVDKRRSIRIHVFMCGRTYT